MIDPYISCYRSAGDKRPHTLNCSTAVRSATLGRLDLPRRQLHAGPRTHEVQQHGYPIDRGDVRDYSNLADESAGGDYHLGSRRKDVEGCERDDARLVAVLHQGLDRTVPHGKGAGPIGQHADHTAGAVD